jgi:DNA-binding Lrp family transcriptional regulator
MPEDFDLRRSYWSVKEAAEKLGISPRRVRKLLAEGRIKGRKLNHTWVVEELRYTKKRGK